MKNLRDDCATHVRQKTGAFLLLTMLLGSAGQALADPIELEAGAGLSSMLIDRGETLATFNNELEISATQPVDWGGIYASVYRITPLGDDKSAFDEEVDYAIGFYTEIDGVGLDVSAAYLTYPGSSEEATVELAAEFITAHAFEPGLAVFYDVDQEVYGAEAFAGPSTEFGVWAVGLLGRVGFVSSPDGDYSYAGLEGTAGRDLSEALSLEAFMRLEAADEDTFASRVEGGNVTRTAAEGAGIGVRITMQH